MKFNTTEIGKIVIGIILLTFLFFSIKETYAGIWNLRHMEEIDMTFNRTIKYIYYSFSYLRPILIILALTGLIKGKIGGWILMNGFFYFLIFEHIFVTIPINSYEHNAYLAVVIPLLPILLSNISKMRNHFNVNHNWIVTSNLAAICYGLSATIIQGYFVVYLDTGYFGIIDKLE